ncbi:MAG TPA: HD domain-containing phosphohydrolase [Candidatus Limnocylindrales bacterium]|nr:HD domain-containing phosphohydrolase [Candidatus Limnocylindrales bacterium]
MSTASTIRVLVVEDDASNRALLDALLRRAGYDVVAIATGADAVRAAHDEGPDVVLLDIELPGMNGLDVCRALRADVTTVALPIILLTGRTETSDVVAGLDAGADDFLRKPFERAELLARIRSVLRLAEAMAEVDGAHGVIVALANAVEAKDELTERHCQRLSTMARQLALAAGVARQDLRPIVLGAMLHDVGKIGIADTLLNKPGPLTPEEWQVMQRHPLIGETICAPLRGSRVFLPVIRHHHERWDGSGYPDRLRGDAIPLGARIVGLVDAFDAMVHDRPYRLARSVEQALDEIRRLAGRQFDPGLVSAFIPLLESEPQLPDERAWLSALRPVAAGL